MGVTLLSKLARYVRDLKICINFVRIPLNDHYEGVYISGAGFAVPGHG